MEDQEPELLPIQYAKSYHKKLLNKEMRKDEEAAGYYTKTEIFEQEENPQEEEIIEEVPETETEEYVMINEGVLNDILQKLAHQETVLKHVTNKLSEFTVAFNGMNKVLQLLNDRTAKMEKEQSELCEVNIAGDAHLRWPIRTFEEFEEMENRVKSNTIFRESVANYFKRKDLRHEKLETYIAANVLRNFSETGRAEMVAFKDSPLMSTIMSAWDESRPIEDLWRMFNSEIVKMRNRIVKREKRPDLDSSISEKRARKTEENYS